MRIRQSSSQRHMMCLIIICVWSFTSMILLWRRIKANDRYKSIRKAIRRQSNDFVFYFDLRNRKHQEIKIMRKSKKRNLNFGKDNTSGNDTASYKLGTEKLLVKLRNVMRPKVDYGRDRDLDVEGVQDYIMWYENFQNSDPQLPTLPRQQRCSKPIQNIAFLKTHYTGSDVITNILNRYGDLNNLNIALPSDGLSTFFWPMRFQWKYIDITLLNGSLPNIISNHARYNNDVMDNILNPGSVYVTILRDPVTQLESTFNNLEFGELLEVRNTTDQIYTFLQDPKFYIQGVIKRKRFKDTLNLIKNAQFFDLGLSTTEYHRRSIIKTTIQELYEKFTIVLIYEHLDESLVLMKRRFCWQLDDILHLKFHYTQHNTLNRQETSEELTEMIRQWNEADQSLYAFFNNTLWDEIKYEGDSFWEELKEFRKSLELIETDCLGKSHENIDINYDIKDEHKFILDVIPTEKNLNVNTNLHPKEILTKYTNKPYKRLSYLDNIYENDRALQTVSNRAPNKSNNTWIESKFKNRTLKDLLMYSNAIKNSNISLSESLDTTVTRSPLQVEKRMNVNMEMPHRSDYSSLENTGKDPASQLVIGSGDNQDFDSGSKINIDSYQNPYSRKHFISDRKLSKTATKWNFHFCKKLLMSESEYLDYFRRKHAYAKAAAKRL